MGNINKMISILVVALFIVSIVPAFALAKDSNPSDTIGQGADENSVTVADNKDSDVKTVEPENYNEDDKTGNDDVTAPSPKGINSAKGLRNAAKHVKTLRERLALAKQRYELAKEHYKEARLRIISAKEKLKFCKDKESDECNAVKDKIKTNGKSFLLHSTDVILSALEKVKDRIEGDENIPEDRKTEILNNIDKRISAVNDAKASVEALNEDATVEDIKNAAKTIREVWKDSRGTLKKGVGSVVNARLGNIIEKAENLRERFQEKRDRFEEKGYDVSEIDSALSVVDEHLDIAKQKYEEMKDLYSSTITPGDVDAVAKQAKDLLKEATKELKEARDAFRDAFTSMMKSAHENSNSDETNNNETGSNETNASA